MLCADVMKSEVECVSPQERIEVVARRMKDKGVGFLPVCNDAADVLGTITDRDIALRIVAEGRPSSTPVEEVMTREVVSCLATDDIKQAERLMGKERKSRILCVDEDGALVGVISLSDIAQRDGARIAQTMQQVTQREART